MFINASSFASLAGLSSQLPQQSANLIGRLLDGRSSNPALVSNGLS